ncbi:LuxR C-terminal-related transcriptional regulator [Streptomyces sp. SID3343]|uniref:helix-turn-helix transcriptional regulator n=1 Tax=Streptomyces sp. SID3343 TaxID=2690260 RepID=UPI001371F8E4|nr:LuxR C-terminal-related transcriptional regulator [Streptomyces sp. SID3343]MYW02700.1 LuxR family transcriptional regulator [Streptomyces sp. SID3343]
MDRRELSAAVGLGLALGRAEGADWVRALDALSCAIPSVGAVQVCGWDPVADRFVVVAERGYRREVSADLSAMPRTRWGRRLVEATRPLLMDDDLDFRASPHFREWLQPAGFDDGLSACLRAEDGRTVGLIHMSAVRGHAFGESARAFVAEVGRTLAPQVDPQHYPHVDAQLTGDWSGSRLTERGQVLALSGRAASPLPADPRFTELAHRFARLRRPPLAFLWPRGRGWEQGLLMDAGRAGNRVGTLVFSRPHPNENRLTDRELHVLTAIVNGTSNPVIAERLAIGRRTVETYVERLLDKLGCASRSELAAVAVRVGLLLPSAEPGSLGDVAALCRGPRPHLPFPGPRRSP